MIHLLRLRMMFARSRIRRQLQFAPEQKDFVQLASVQQQLEQLREEYKTDLGRPELFSQVLAEKGNQKLGPIFSVDKRRLNKSIRSQFLESFRGVAADSKEDAKQQREALLPKSHLYQQNEQIEMEKEFKKQLFRKKETKRLIDKKLNTPQNWLPESSDNDLHQYLEAKKALKNMRIGSIMEGTQTNHALELLIQSGLMDNPQNLGKMIQALDKTPENTLNLPAPTLDKEAQTKIDKMNLDVRGQMIETKDFEKLKDFYLVYQQKNQQNKQKTRQMMDLFSEIREYEDETFEKRYDTINFRYKGRVDFNFFTEQQLMSYIKHQKIEPKDLMLIFAQNIGRVTKSSPPAPIITPAVASQLYSKTSLFKFPQTQTNNRINMLSDKNFIGLERYVFENIDKVDNTFFTDALYSFSFNHFEEQGALKPRMFEAVARKICTELEERIGYLPEEDLGSVCRSMCKLPVFREGYLDEQALITALQDRIQSIDSVFVLENVCLFTSMLRSNDKCKVLVKAIPLFASKVKDWDPDTVLNITRAFAPLLRIALAPEVTTSLRQLFVKNETTIVNLLETVNLNNCRLVAGFLVKLGEYNIKIFNRIKKTTIETFRKQLCKLNADTVPEIAASLSFFDYHQKYKTNSISNHSLIQSFFPRSVLQFNSAKYLPYHEIAKFTTDEYQYLTPKYVVMIAKYLSLSGYKNESFFDGICERMIEGLASDKTLLRHFISMYSCFWLQRRDTDLSRAILKIITEGDWKKFSCRVEEWIELIASLANIGEEIQSKSEILENIFVEKIWPYRQFLSNEQRIACISAFAATNSKDQVIKMLDSLTTPIDYKGLNLECKLLLIISSEIFKASSKIELSIGEKIDTLEQLEGQYLRKVQSDIKERHLAIGGVLPYDQVYKEMAQQTLKIEGANSQVVQKPWRVEVPDKKIVNVLVSYDMVITVTSAEEGSNIRLNGLWKLYQQLYSRMGYKVDIVESYLWRNMAIQPVKSV